jgi:hypothetical protein
VRYEGSAYSTEIQRARLLYAAGEVVREHGYGRLTVTRLTSWSGVSVSVFRDLFDDPEDCFLQAFEEAVLSAEGIAKTAYSRTRGAWRLKIRAALAAVLVFLDERPDLRALVISESAKAGPRVAERYAAIVCRVGRVLRESARGVTENGDWLPDGDGECTVQSVLSMAQTLSWGEDPEPLCSRLNILMGVLVLRYEGPAAAERELASSERAPSIASARPGAARGVLQGSKIRVTYRTLAVLNVIFGAPGLSNHAVACAADIKDEGQASKLLAKLARLELIENRGPGYPSGAANEWHLTPYGQELLGLVAPVPSSRDRGCRAERVKDAA